MFSIHMQRPLSIIWLVFCMTVRAYTVLCTYHLLFRYSHARPIFLYFQSFTIRFPAHPSDWINYGNVIHGFILMNLGRGKLAVCRQHSKWSVTRMLLFAMMPGATPLKDVHSSTCRRHIPPHCQMFARSRNLSRWYKVLPRFPLVAEQSQWTVDMCYVTCVFTLPYSHCFTTFAPVFIHTCIILTV